MTPTVTLALTAPEDGILHAIYVEEDEPYALDAEVIAALEGLGYEIARWGTIGDVHVFETWISALVRHDDVRHRRR